MTGAAVGRSGLDIGEVLDLVLVRPAPLGSTRLLCVDGPAGSGKTTFAERLASHARTRGLTTAVVHMDDLFEGWTGLPDAGRRVLTQLVQPLAEGSAASYERYDWDRGCFSERVPVPEVDLLVVEGVGSGDASYRDRTSLLAWVWAPRALRLTRGLRRDGDAMEPHWRRWMEEEDRHHAADRTAQRADVLVDGRNGRISPGPTASP